ncbi:CLIP domain-containing serine protease HP8-like [Armigeres subalbatus]|uniref:CLIP domain-containing serine protease HP8-like n=1 Tax=Armigeres subalbatus TaxID=124917 RepID=UPI002ED53ED3
MKLRRCFLIAGSVLVCLPTTVVLGQKVKQCSAPEKCIALKECPEFTNYVGTSHKTWPQNVLNGVLSRFCGSEDRGSGKIHKVCCPVAGRSDPNAGNPKKGVALLDLKQCGKQSKPRIANGKIAEIFDFPWMALLRGIEEKFHCGGSLIAERYVLTAAHCNFIKVWYVRLGETDLSKKEDCKVYPDGEKECADPPQDIPVERFIRHKYSASRKKNDIALVKLERPAQLNDNVRTICLPLPEVSRDKLPKSMSISGWGYTETKNDVSEQLRYAYIPIVDLNRCNDTLKRLKTPWSVDNSQVCAGAGDDKADNCHGDSGGPLQYFGKRGYVIYGVVSYGVATCGTETEPGVYTKVSHYLSWIIDNLV